MKAIGLKSISGSASDKGNLLRAEIITDNGNLFTLTIDITDKRYESVYKQIQVLSNNIIELFNNGKL